ncbi:MAG: hypothetical protein KIT09_29035 [Bryobacteraceae bacterium]|nr:hypothetical protein [Bryobacteraceae bacterium]
MELARLGSKLIGLGRFAWGLRSFLDERLTLEQAVQVIEDGVRRREERFLAKLDTAVYANPGSPYRKLLEAAGCEAGDVRKLVAAEGLEGALERLARAGVYVGYEEFKGRQPAVRGGRTFHFRPEEFDDPRMVPDLRSTTGGTRGKPAPTTGNLDQIAQMVPHWLVFFAENGCLDGPLVFWTPDHAGVASRHLSCAKFGLKYSRWFVSEEMTAVKDRFYSVSIHWLVRRAAGLPAPERAPYDNPAPVLDCLLAFLEEGKRPCVNTAPSAAVKLSLAAQQRGASLSGVTFLLGSEPLTPARRRAIEGSGARAAPLYGSTEATWIGGQCRQARHPDEAHALLDTYAVIGAPEEDGEERSLLLTSLQPITPKVLLNTDIGDRAAITRRRCDCLYDRLDCRTTLHAIRSSDKITEFGVTFAVSDVAQVLEEALPRRFGGAAGDFQLVEARDALGLAHYTLRVSPALEGVDAGAAPEAFLAELAKVRSYYGFMARMWARERIVGVERGAPLATGRGKVLPFHRATES